MELVEPSEQYKDSFIAAVREFQADHENEARLSRYRELSPEDLAADLKPYLARVQAFRVGATLPEGYVPESEFWLVDGGEFIGRASIRHQLTEKLRTLGGHIGYDIRPSRRRQGCGTALLRLALEKARELGIDRVLVTCDATNEASRRIIEKNGGVLENQVPNPAGGPEKLRYWIG